MCTSLTFESFTYYEKVRIAKNICQLDLLREISHFWDFWKKDKPFVYMQGGADLQELVHFKYSKNAFSPGRAQAYPPLLRYYFLRWKFLNFYLDFGWVTTRAHEPVYQNTNGSTNTNTLTKNITYVIGRMFNEFSNKNYAVGGASYLKSK